MKAATLTIDGAARLVDRPAPAAHGDLVVVRVELAPMCTEFRLRADGRAHDGLGHEAVGVVVDAGDSERVAAGDRVVVMPGLGCGRCALCAEGEYIYCPNQRDLHREVGDPFADAGYAEFLLKPDYLLLPIPDDVSSDHAAAASCLLGPGHGAAERLGVARGETLIVGGCGPVGLGAVIVAVARGAAVVALESTPYRQALARALGAETFSADSAGLAPAVHTFTAGAGAATAIETRPVGTAQLVELIRPLGRLAIVSWGADVALPPIVPRGLTIHGCWHWNHECSAERMWDLVRRVGAQLDTVITHRFPLSDFGEAMEVQQSRQCGKVLLVP